MTTADKKPLDRQTMCSRLAMEFEDGWIANLGAGMPTLCSNYDFKDKDIIYQSENGLIGYGPLAKEGEEHPNLVNAGVQYVTLRPGSAIVKRGLAPEIDWALAVWFKHVRLIGM